MNLQLNSCFSWNFPPAFKNKDLLETFFRKEITIGSTQSYWVPPPPPPHASVAPPQDLRGRGATLAREEGGGPIQTTADRHSGIRLQFRLFSSLPGAYHFLLLKSYCLNLIDLLLVIRMNPSVPPTSE